MEQNRGVKMAYSRVVNIGYKVLQRLETAIKNWSEEGFKSFLPAFSRVTLGQVQTPQYT